MPMRINCRHYESRTYPNGDTVRKCDLDLAPEAPWRCPEDCPSFTPRVVDMGWDHGSLSPDLSVPEPSSVGEDESIAALLDAAEDVVNDAGPRILAELEDEQAKARRSFFGRFRKRRR
ncbi:MAG: hypothetical protein AAFZ07_17260 [Actinomycetota bacterium]